ncbi:MAG TPA: hypothetical protein VLE95_07155 [Chlamydiales bacterium]|nr:hypothetical protein [Chlamydiales bacterium]
MATIGDGLKIAARVVLAGAGAAGTVLFGTATVVLTGSIIQAAIDAKKDPSVFDYETRARKNLMEKNIGQIIAGTGACALLTHLSYRISQTALCGLFAA